VEGVRVAWRPRLRCLGNRSRAQADRELGACHLATRAKCSELNNFFRFNYRILTIRCEKVISFPKRLLLSRVQPVVSLPECAVCRHIVACAENHMLTGSFRRL
jgi:hypothetical protein